MKTNAIITKRKLDLFSHTKKIGKNILFFCLFFGAFLNAPANASEETISSSTDGSHFKIEIDIQQQLVKVFENDFLIKEMPCSTGMNNMTPTGSFTSYEKIESAEIEMDETVISYYYLTKFNGNFALHSKIFGDHPFVEEGNEKFEKGEPSSMGCIRLLLPDAKWLYDEIGLGVTVEVY